MKLLVSALERSSNLHLSHLLPYLPNIELVGIFDKNLGNPIADTQNEAVMGFIDAAKKINYFLKLKKQMLKLASEADKILLMDSSGFNLPLAKAIKKNYPDKEIIYYILPQAWAWRRGRVKIIEKVVDKALSILPFETKIYSPNYNITYVGHPLLDEIKDFKQKPTKDDTIAFMPGSRPYEIKTLMPLFRTLRRHFKEKKALLVVPKNMDLTLYGDISDFTITHNSHKALYQSHFAYICSGTATLEAALIGTPLALCYKAKKIDYFIAKTFAHIKNVGLANIMIANTHPEFLQENLNLKNLIEAYEKSSQEEFLKKSKALRDYLRHGSAKNVARIIDA